MATRLEKPRSDLDSSPRIKRSQIHVENSAPSQRQPAYSVRWAAPLLKKVGVSSVCDIGCGRLRNLKPMQDNFSGITLVDTKIQCSKIDEEAKKQRHVRLLTSEAFERDKKKYDAIFIICVLHIVPSVRERREIIDAAVGKLNDRGMIVVDVPQSETYYNRKKDSLLPYQDGHLLKWGSSYTFYKSFFREEFDDLFMRTGALEIADQVYQSKHLIRMWRKKDKA